MKSHKIVRLGVGRTFQTATVFEQLTVLQNLDIAAGLHRKALGRCCARAQGARARRGGAGDDRPDGARRDRPAGILAHGQKQWLEIGMLLVQDAKVLFLDETVAGMSAEEREETGELLQRIVGDRTIVVVEHDMDFMRTLRRLRDGACTPARCSPRARVAEIQADPKVQEVYLGTATEVALDG